MLLKKKNKFKPIFKSLIRLRENVQSRSKLLKFKRKKWQSFIFHCKRKLKYYNRFKPKDQMQLIVTKHPNRGTSYKKNYRDTLGVSRRFRMFYGGLSKKVIKKKIKLILNKKGADFNLSFLHLFERRLDIVLHRSKLATSLRNARQMIVHKKILINKQIVNSPNYTLNLGDLISVNPKYSHVIVQNLIKSDKWPIPPKYLHINYRTMEILFGNPKFSNFTLGFPFHLNLEKLLTNYYYQ
jgi:ribosomal protein S4